jgi:hypothetical protein
VTSTTYFTIHNSVSSSQVVMEPLGTFTLDSVVRVRICILNIEGSNATLNVETCCPFCESVLSRVWGMRDENNGFWFEWLDLLAPWLQVLLITLKYSVIADLHTFQFTVAHALGFSVFSNRFLATDLNTETSASRHYEVFLLFRLQPLCTPLS